MQLKLGNAENATGGKKVTRRRSTTTSYLSIPVSDA
jgi:hypothetical protein